MGLDLSVLALLAAFITAIVEMIKAWVPAKYKDMDGLIVPYSKGKKHFHIPNQAVWPTLSLIIGIGVFLLLKYNVFGTAVDSSAGAAVSGGAAALGSNGVYRIKTKLGNLFGGTDDTNAQNTGPGSSPSPTDVGEITPPSETPSS
jgi:hypothetical protein